MRVLLSIKPEYAEKIFDGTKKFEFRRIIFKNKKVRTVVVYASSPLQKVIGEFEIEEILDCQLEELWKQTKDYSGISKEYFDSYFIRKEKGFAIKVKNVIRYPINLSLRDNYQVNPPQSFVYI